MCAWRAGLEPALTEPALTKPALTEDANPLRWQEDCYFLTAATTGGV